MRAGPKYAAPDGLHSRVCVLGSIRLSDGEIPISCNAAYGCDLTKKIILLAGSVRDQPFVESQFSPDPEPIAP